MKRAISGALTVVLMLGLAACASPKRLTYDEVRQDTLDSMQAVADIIPEPKTIRPRPEFEPYGCSDPLLGMNRDGAFYTGYWEVEVEEDLDVPEFVTQLRTNLGDEWVNEPQRIRVSFAQTNLVRKTTGVSVTVEERERNGKKGIDILAISRCGVEEPAS